ncbi:hypothetical protein ACJX0J_040420, partial [Zea mays]
MAFRWGFLDLDIILCLIEPNTNRDLIDDFITNETSHYGHNQGVVFGGTSWYLLASDFLLLLIVEGILLGAHLAKKKIFFYFIYIYLEACLFSLVSVILSSL